MIEIFLWRQVIDKGVITIYKNRNHVWKKAAAKLMICFWLAAVGCGNTAFAMSPAMVEIGRGPQERILYEEEIAQENREEPPVKAEVYDSKFESLRESIMFASLRVNMRQWPSTDAEILTVLRPNTEVTVQSHENGWYQVSYGNGGTDEITYGYVKEEYLSQERLAPAELNKWHIELTPEEIDLLAKILWVEARGEPYEGQAAVIEVIFNRMVSGDSDFPENDLEGIVSSKTNGTQFASWNLRDTATPTENLYQVIYDVLEGAVEVLPSTDYVFFTTGGIGRNIIRIGNHRFGTQ